MPDQARLDAIYSKIAANESRSREAAYIVVDSVQAFLLWLGEKVQAKPAKGPIIFGLQVRENAYMLPRTYAFVDATGNVISIHKYE